MGIFNFVSKRSNEESQAAAAAAANEAELKRKVNQLLEIIRSEGISCGGYTSLDQDPTIMTACERIAELIGLVSWHLMENTDNGDQRIRNELSRKIDINPNSWMTRQTFFEAIAMNLLLYGDGNCVVRPHTEDGYLRDLEVIPADRVSFMEDQINGYGYWILIDGIRYDPRDLLHFRLTPDKQYPWKGRGIRVSINEVANNLKQASSTENAFLSQEWKPSVIVKVQAMGEEFATPEGREKIADDYLKTNKAGEPWIVPAEQMDISTLKPLTLQDLAIADTVKLNKATAAAIVGVPNFLVGIGDFKKDEFNNFIQTRVRTIVEGIQQTLTAALITSPRWYIKGNIWALLDWDLSTITQVFTAMGDRGWVTGNEARDRINLEPKEGLDELKVLENYIPASMSGNQSKLTGGNDDE
jgi:HK97 family phage portal protein